MATVLDVGLLKFFSPIITFVFIFGLMYGVMQKTKILGGNKGLDGIAAVTIALLFIIMPGASKLVEVATPWFILLLMFVVIAMLFFLMLGVKPDIISEFAQESTNVWLIMIMLFIIGGIAITQVFGEDIRNLTSPDDSGNQTFGSTIGKILFDPRVLGAFLILAIAAQAVRLISKGF
ncbi:hypothetical protein J4468_02205 [Candidatus Woesearchaeota archaeon]|nr:hypothetical protein [Candidatus Woesearchaeota archaeon]